MSLIQELDSHFAPLESTEEFDWYDGAQMPIYGSAWQSESDGFCRLPDRAQSLLREPVWELSRHSAGIALEFTSNAKSLAVRWNLRNEALAMPHMAATGVSGCDLYARKDGRWRWMAIVQPTAQKNEAVVVNDLDGQTREYRLYLPLYNGVTSLQIGVSRGASLASATEKYARKPICFYGTSIVQGGCASRPAMAYPAILSHRLDWPAINLGFSGNAHCESEIADLLGELDPQIYVLDPLPNMNAEMIEERLENFILTLRASRPNTPIVLVENIIYAHAIWLRQSDEIWRGSNAAARAIYQKLRRADENLHLIPTADLLGDDGEATVDGVHPTDLGFARMADVIAPVLQSLL